MAILDLQRRLREIGRIRIGEQRVSAKNGKKYPAKLTTFRLTSQDGAVISQAAETFGGEPRRWADAPAGEQFEVVTESSSLDVIVPPTGMAFSQFYELWSGGGCLRRCDGRRELISDSECLCDPSARECKPHTRLSVILRDLPGLGVWRLDTQGYYAAVELSGVVEVCQQAAERGQMLPARLRLEQREVKRPNQPTMHFAVPVLDVAVDFAALLAGQQHYDAVEAPARPGLTPVDQAALPPAPEVPIASQVAAVNEPKDRKPRKGAATPIPATGKRPRTAVEAAEEPPSGEPSLSPAQAVAVALKNAGYATDDERHEAIRQATGGAKASSKELTAAEARAVIEWAKNQEPPKDTRKANVAKARESMLTPTQNELRKAIEAIKDAELRRTVKDDLRATYKIGTVAEMADEECEIAIRTVAEHVKDWDKAHRPDVHLVKTEAGLYGESEAPFADDPQPTLDGGDAA